MHEQGADEMVARETRSPLEQRRADAAVPITGEDCTPQKLDPVLGLKGVEKQFPVLSLIRAC